MKINIYKSTTDYPHILYGDVLPDGRNNGDMFDRVYIWQDGKVEICNRREYPNGSFDDGDAYGHLNTSMHKNVIEHTLLRFFGNIEFCWDIDAIEYLAMNALDRISESLEVDDA